MNQDINQSKNEIELNQNIKCLNASIVRFSQPFEMIATLVDLLTQSFAVHTIYVIDNSPIKEPKFQLLPIQYITNDQNIGFGRAHNIAIKKSIDCNIKYHVIVNPDISFDSKILSRIVYFMEINKTVGALMPKVFYPNGNLQYVCKLLPTPIDLLAKRFLPKNWTNRRLNRFQLKDSGYNNTMNIPYLSGCFMVLQTDALKHVGLFDERFFLYPEDIDLSRRIHEHYETMFYPEVSVIHSHEQGSYNNLKLFAIHSINMIRYFNKWGWINDKKRKQINQQVLEQIYFINHNKL